MADEVKENNKQLVCEIKIDIEMMRKIIDEKMTQIELDIQGIRAEAIDEFAERMKDKIFNHFTYIGIIEEPADYSDYIDEIAEELKGVRDLTKTRWKLST